MSFNVELGQTPSLRITLSPQVLTKVQANLYELAQQDGFSGSLTEFLGSLKVQGENGATFTPHIENGVLSWINDGGLPNPEPVTIVRDYTNLGKIVKHILGSGIK